MKQKNKYFRVAELHVYILYVYFLDTFFSCFYINIPVFDTINGYNNEGE